MSPRPWPCAFLAPYTRFDPASCCTLPAVPHELHVTTDTVCGSPISPQQPDPEPDALHPSASPTTPREPLQTMPFWRTTAFPGPMRRRKDKTSASVRLMSLGPLKAASLAKLRRSSISAAFPRQPLSRRVPSIRPHSMPPARQMGRALAQSVEIVEIDDTTTSLLQVAVDWFSVKLQSTSDASLGEPRIRIRTPPWPHTTGGSVLPRAAAPAGGYARSSDHTSVSAAQPAHRADQRQTSTLRSPSNS